MTIDNPSRLIEFIRDNFKSDDYIYAQDGGWLVTDEWLVGTFAGRGFYGSTLDEAAQKLIEFLNSHVGHDSIVGNIVTKSGWPSEMAVKKYISAIAEEGAKDERED